MLAVLDRLRSPTALESRLASRLRAEFLTLAELGHPSLPRVREFGWCDDGDEKGRSWFYTYEPVDGLDLDLWAREASTDELYEVALKLLEVLFLIHDRGVLHLDVKPANIVVHHSESGPVPVLLDFGASGDAKPKAGAPPLESSENGISGTLPYLSPEVLRGDPPGPAADLYALGVTLYEAYAGERPYEAETLEELLREQERKIPVPPRPEGESAHALEILCWRLLAPDPGRRLAGARRTHGVSDCLRRY